MSDELYRAAHAGDEEAVRRLLRERPDEPKIGALTAASTRGHTGIVGMLLEAGASPADAPDPLHWAVRRDHFEIVKLLVEAGADVDATNDMLQNRSPVYWAKLKRRLDVAEYLRARRKPGVTHRSRWAGLSGLAEPGTYRDLLLVNMPIEPAGEAFTRATGAAEWLRDMVDKDVTVTDRSFFVVQFIGSRWTIFDKLTETNPLDLTYAGPSVARAAGAPAVAYRSGVSPYRITYRWFDASGEEAEALYWGEPKVFDLAAVYPQLAGEHAQAFAEQRDGGGLTLVARRRQVTRKPSRPKLAAVARQVDRLFRRHAILIPAFMRSGSALPGQQINMGVHYILERYDVERVDYISLN